MRTVCWISFAALLWNVVNEQTNELLAGNGEMWMA